jgi:hypothetical protein
LRVKLVVPSPIYFKDLATNNKIRPNISSHPRSIVAVRTHFPDSPTGADNYHFTSSPPLWTKTGLSFDGKSKETIERLSILFGIQLIHDQQSTILCTPLRISMTVRRGPGISSFSSLIRISAFPCIHGRIYRSFPLVNPVDDRILLSNIRSSSYRSTRCPPCPQGSQ